MSESTNVSKPADQGGPGLEYRLDVAAWQPHSDFVPLTYEKIIGIDNLLSVAWLQRGLELASSVMRIVLPDGFGTGFLIARDLVLTNHHVIPDQTVGGRAAFEFNYQNDWSGRLGPVQRYSPQPDRFHTNKTLDYTIIGVQGNPGDLFGFVDLAQRGTVAVNDFVCIIQQPKGGPKQIGLTDNKVSAVFGAVTQYTTDTEPGSSGSPVFNQQWVPVALHHSGGGLVGPDGAKSFANEGILINEVVRDAAAFLGISDPLSAVVFSEMRNPLLDVIAAASPADVRTEAADLMKLRPRLGMAVQDWLRLQGTTAATPSQLLTAAGVAVGAALRQWARTQGHESLPIGGLTGLAPSDALTNLVAAHQSPQALPTDIYLAVMPEVLSHPDTVAPYPEFSAASDDLAALVAVFLGATRLGAAASESTANVVPRI